MKIDHDYRDGAVWGLALGDAWGYPAEFRTYAVLTEADWRGPKFPREARVSDDTQMSLAVWHALDRADVENDADLTAALIDEFQAWRVDPDNDRAPGTTCMTALGRMEGAGWLDATVEWSKGCGTVMRAPWIGLHPKVSGVAASRLSAVAQLQAAITHGHPTAVLGADLLSWLTLMLATGEASLQTIGRDARGVLGELAYEPILGDLWRRAGADSPSSWASLGLDELSTAVDSVIDQRPILDADPWGCDPCTLTGEGWTAETCIATALLIASTFAEDPASALRRAACTGGDSDSIAAVVGALIGAAYGDCWPVRWIDALEPRYRAELSAITGGSR